MITGYNVLNKNELLQLKNIVGESVYGNGFPLYLENGNFLLENNRTIWLQKPVKVLMDGSTILLNGDHFPKELKDIVKKADNVYGHYNYIAKDYESIFKLINNLGYFRECLVPGYRIFPNPDINNPYTWRTAFLIQEAFYDISVDSTIKNNTELTRVRSLIALYNVLGLQLNGFKIPLGTDGARFLLSNLADLSIVFIKEFFKKILKYNKQEYNFLIEPLQTPKRICKDIMLNIKINYDNRLLNIDERYRLEEPTSFTDVTNIVPIEVGNVIKDLYTRWHCRAKLPNFIYKDCHWLERITNFKDLKKLAIEKVGNEELLKLKGFLDIEHPFPDLLQRVNERYLFEDYENEVRFAKNNNMDRLISCEVDHKGYESFGMFPDNDLYEVDDINLGVSFKNRIFEFERTLFKEEYKDLEDSLNKDPYSSCPSGVNNYVYENKGEKSQMYQQPQNQQQIYQDQYGNLYILDQYGNPIFVDQYGNIIQNQQLNTQQPIYNNMQPTMQQQPMQNNIQQQIYQDQYGNLYVLDQYNNPIFVDQYGNPLPNNQQPMQQQMYNNTMQQPNMNNNMQQPNIYQQPIQQPVVQPNYNNYNNEGVGKWNKDSNNNPNNDVQINNNQNNVNTKNINKIKEVIKPKEKINEENSYKYIPLESEYKILYDEFKKEIKDGKLPILLSDYKREMGIDLVKEGNLHPHKVAISRPDILGTFICYHNMKVKEATLNNDENEINKHKKALDIIYKVVEANNIKVPPFAFNISYENYDRNFNRWISYKELMEQRKELDYLILSNLELKEKIDNIVTEDQLKELKIELGLLEDPRKTNFKGFNNIENRKEESINKNSNLDNNLNDNIDIEERNKIVERYKKMAEEFPNRYVPEKIENPIYIELKGKVDIDEMDYTDEEIDRLDIKPPENDPYYNRRTNIQCSILEEIKEALREKNRLKREQQQNEIVVDEEENNTEEKEEKINKVNFKLKNNIKEKDLVDSYGEKFSFEKIAIEVELEDNKGKKLLIVEPSVTEKDFIRGNTEVEFTLSKAEDILNFFILREELSDKELTINESDLCSFIVEINKKNSNDPNFEVFQNLRDNILDLMYNIGMRIPTELLNNVKNTLDLNNDYSKWIKTNILIDKLKETAKELIELKSDDEKKLEDYLEELKDNLRKEMDDKDEVIENNEKDIPLIDTMERTSSKSNKEDIKSKLFDFINNELKDKVKNMSVEESLMLMKDFIDILLTIRDNPTDPIKEIDNEEEIIEENNNEEKTSEKENIDKEEKDDNKEENKIIRRDIEENNIEENKALILYDRNEDPLPPEEFYNFAIEKYCRKWLDESGYDDMLSSEHSYHNLYMYLTAGGKLYKDKDLTEELQLDRESLKGLSDDEINVYIHPYFKADIPVDIKNMSISELVEYYGEYFVYCVLKEKVLYNNIKTIRRIGSLAFEYLNNKEEFMSIIATGLENKIDPYTSLQLIPINYKQLTNYAFITHMYGKDYEYIEDVNGEYGTIDQDKLLELMEGQEIVNYEDPEENDNYVDTTIEDPIEYIKTLHNSVESNLIRMFPCKPSDILTDEVLAMPDKDFVDACYDPEGDADGDPWLLGVRVEKKILKKLKNNHNEAAKVIRANRIARCMVRDDQDIREVFGDDLTTEKYRILLKQEFYMTRDELADKFVTSMPIMAAQYRNQPVTA